ncbi:DUF4115 domain-containing protein [Desulfovibrio sp. OttesenSCG-928-A18]|nr:DUF4115 domain-containing protein [Desulfovibrio sp. OttesenSCG-928-A18]
MTLLELGQSLKEKREAAGLSIDDVAARIKVSIRILKNIELGSLDGLPHAVYTKSFIRSFGLLVGYDPEELSKILNTLFPQEAMDESKKDHIMLSKPLNTSPGGGRTVILFLLLLAVLGGLGAGGWYVAKNYGDDILNFIKKPFSAISSPAAPESRRPAESGAEAPPAAPVTPVPAAPAGGQTAPSSFLHSPEPIASGHGSAMAATNPPPYGGPVYNPGTAQSPDRSVAQPQPTLAVAAPVDTAPDSARQEPANPENGAGTDSGGAEQTPDGESVASAPDAPLVVEIPLEHQMIISARRTCWVGATVDGEKLRPFTLKPGQQRTLIYTKNLEMVLGNPTGVTLVHNGKDIGAPTPGERVLRFPKD